MTIYKKVGTFQKPKLLGESINTPAYETDVFVAPNESAALERKATVEEICISALRMRLAIGQKPKTWDRLLIPKVTNCALL